MPDILVQQIKEAVQEHGSATYPYAVALTGFFLRLILGRHYKAMDQVAQELGQIKERVATIEGVLRERDHHKDTWPGDSE